MLNADPGGRARAALTQGFAGVRSSSGCIHPAGRLKLFENIEDLLSKALGPGIDIGKQIPADLPALLIDSNQLELFLLNLFVNARDAMTGGGVITVSADEDAMSRPGGLAPGRYIRISVSDNGVGMDEATAARAAGPFFTAKGSARAPDLGLSMVHGLAQLSPAVSLTCRASRGRGQRSRYGLPIAGAQFATKRLSDATPPDALP